MSTYAAHMRTDQVRSQREGVHTMLQNQALLHFAEPIRDTQQLLDTPKHGN
jgi:hypothetical protein